MKWWHVYFCSLAIDTLKELLSTYTNSKSNLSETLQEAEQYAKELIVLVIREPSIFIFDDVVTLVRPLKEAAPHMVYEVKITNKCHSPQPKQRFTQLQYHITPKQLCHFCTGHIIYWLSSIAGVVV